MDPSPLIRARESATRVRHRLPACSKQLPSRARRGGDVQWSVLISFVSPRGPYWLKNISDRSSSFPSSKATMNKVLSEGTGSHRTQNESRIHFRGRCPTSRLQMNKRSQHL